MEKLVHDLKNGTSLSDQKIGKSEETKAPLPSCLMIKKQQDVHRRLAQSQSLRRRLRMLHKRLKVPPGSLQGNSSVCEPVDVLQPQEPAVMFQPGMYKETLQQFLQVLRSPKTPEQQQKIIHILKSNPRLLAAFIKQRQISRHQKPLEHMIHSHHSNNSGRIVVTSDVGHSQLAVETTGKQPQEPAVMFQPAMYKETLQHLLKLLRSPNTREQQQKIIHILKANPPLLAAFIKQRQISQHQKPLEHMIHPHHSSNNGRIVVTSDAGHSQLAVETTGKTFNMVANNMSRSMGVGSSHNYGSSIGGPAEPKGLNVPLKSQITQQQSVGNENTASLYKLPTSSTTFVGGTSHVENSENEDRMSSQSIGKNMVDLSYSQPLSNIASGSQPGPPGGTSGGMQDNSQIHTTSIMHSEERKLIQQQMENLSFEDLEGLLRLLQLE